MDLQGKAGAGRFQWNLGGWFGSQVGGTLWLVLLGGVLWAKGQGAGAALLGLGLAANALGCFLWTRRQILDPYLALQLLLGACGIAAALSMWLLAGAGVTAADAGLPSLWAVLIYPALMAWFAFLEHQTRRAS